MKYCIRLLGILLGFGLVAGCASQPTTEKGSEVAVPKAAEPTYNEKVKALDLTQVKGVCPADSKWENLQWKAIVPLTNGCVKAKEWRKVERMGNFLAVHAYVTPWGPYYLSLSAESRHDYPRAVWMLELALKKDPSEGLFQYELGRINWDMHEDAEALRHLQLASNLNPSLTEAHWLMGQMAAERQDYAAAEVYFKKALESNSKHMPTLLSEAALKLNSKDWSGAEAYLNQIIALNPHASKSLLLRAQLQEEQLKKWSEALQNYKQLKRLNAETKLDERITINLDEKIQVLEKSMAQAKKTTPAVTGRTPSGEGRVAQ